MVGMKRIPPFFILLYAARQLLEPFGWVCVRTGIGGALHERKNCPAFFADAAFSAAFRLRFGRQYRRRRSRSHARALCL
ncbi:hypothetical protein SDC9_208409 [bioreactor metagenome]|uniref:Uncharacterized protein n=1 Tax=bioreactor metagenome TaxID=1076179 RepID=A0A645JAJ8_9ZZZZ